VSTIIEFFSALGDGAAADVLEDGPQATFETVSAGNFDVFSSILEWDSILTERDLDEVIDDESIVQVAGGDDNADEAVVYKLPDTVVRGLADTDDDSLPRVARRWVAARAEDDAPIDEEYARELLSDLADLARAALAAGEYVYCWVS
jgi:hypothetical protein